MKAFYTILLVLWLPYQTFTLKSFIFNCSPKEKDFNLEVWKSYYKWGKCNAHRLLKSVGERVFPKDEDIASFAWDVWREQDPSLSSQDRQKFHFVIAGIKDMSLVEWRDRFDFVQHRSNLTELTWERVYTEAKNRIRVDTEERKKYRRLVKSFENLEIGKWKNVYQFRNYSDHFTTTELLQYLLVRLGTLDFTSVDGDQYAGFTDLTSVDGGSNNNTLKGFRRLVWDYFGTFAMSYCPYRCRDGQVVSINNLDSTCPVKRCQPCSCLMPECLTYGVCCPDIGDDNSELPGLAYEVKPIADLLNINPVRKTHYSSKYQLPKYESITKIVCETTENNETFLSVGSCDSHLSWNASIVSQCEDDIHLDNVTVDNYLWVEDVERNVVYHNMYCARCNQVKNPKMVSYTISFDKHPKVSNSNNEDENLRIALRLSQLGLATVRRHFPSHVTTFSCKELQSSNKEMHLAPYFKTFYTIKCETFETFYSKLVDSMINKDNSQLEFDCLDETMKEPDEIITVSYEISAVPNYYSRMESEMKSLTRKHYIFSNQIKTEIARSKPFVHYKLKMWMLPRKGKFTLDSLSGLLMNVFTQKIIEIISYQNKSFKLTTGHLSTQDTRLNPQSSREITTLWIVSHIYNVSSEDMKQFQSYMISKFMNNDIEVKVSGHSVSFTEQQMMESLQNIHYCNVPQTSITCTEHAFCSINPGKIGAPSQCPITLREYNKYVKVHSHEDSKTVPQVPLLYGDQEFSRHSRFGNNQNESVIILDIAMTLTCNYISFNRSHFNITINMTSEPPRLSVTVDFDDFNIEFWEVSDVNMMSIDDDDTLNVCYKLLDERAHQLRSSMISDIDRIMHILLFICVGFSILCLLITLITYVRFRSLRTAAGENNIFLSLSLLLAQCTVLVRTYSPTELYLCVGVGVTSHFLWLWMFSWTFICCYHMVRTFASKTKYTGWSVMKKVITSLVFPTLVVSAVIIGSYTTSGSSGYGLPYCYLDTFMLVEIALIGPMVVVNVANLTCFIITVCHIHRVRQMQSFRKDKRSMFCNYVKLSSLTGLFWTLDIIAETQNSDILRIISIVLNGLQGVFIFISFLCNKKVFDLYKSSMKCKF